MKKFVIIFFFSYLWEKTLSTLIKKKFLLLPPLIAPQLSPNPKRKTSPSPLPTKKHLLLPHRHKKVLSHFHQRSPLFPLLPTPPHSSPHPNPLHAKKKKKTKTKTLLSPLTPKKKSHFLPRQQKTSSSHPCTNFSPLNQRTPLIPPSPPPPLLSPQRKKIEGEIKR